MKIVFLGNPNVSVTILDSLLKTKHEIVGVVSNSPKISGRGLKKSYTPVGVYAINNKLELLCLSSFKDEKLYKALKKLNPDLFIVVAFKIIPQKFLNLPKFGAINLHASLLPSYRGASPIQYALLNGDKKTGVTTFLIDDKIDNGKIIMQKEFKINDNDNYESLIKKVESHGSDLVIKTIDRIANKNIYQEQNENYISYAPKIQKKMLLINCFENSNINHNKVRAFSPTPGAFVKINKKRLKILKTRKTSIKSPKENISKIFIKKNKVLIGCSEHFLELLEVQFEGKKKMNALNWARGMIIGSKGILLNES
ncbi:MAG: methionyl-tRNA formyltransferase [bacterium TMED144]|nr:MAG: methionyl-tRNA formyltransferase [bacterium TMED144]